MTSLTEVFNWFFNNLWMPAVDWISGTFNVTPILASIILLIFISGVIGAINESRRKAMIRQAVIEAHTKIHKP